MFGHLSVVVNRSGVIQFFNEYTNPVFLSKNLDSLFAEWLFFIDEIIRSNKA